MPLGQELDRARVVDEVAAQQRLFEGEEVGGGAEEVVAGLDHRRQLEVAASGTNLQCVLVAASCGVCGEPVRVRASGAVIRSERRSANEPLVAISRMRIRSWKPVSE